jgi:Primase C terminal 1 (PriCT-1)
MLAQNNNPHAGITEQYFSALHPELRAGECIELRCKATTASSSMRRVFVSSVERATEWAVAHVKNYDAYAGAATRCGEDGTKRGVCRLWALWADLDARAGHTRESRLGQLMELPCHPSMLVWTGGGFHAYWFLRSPAESPQELDHAELVMRQLAAGLDSDSVHDRSRIMRVPGTLNHKYGQPRPVELARYEPDRRYDLAQLWEMTIALPGGLSAGDTASGGQVPHGVLTEPIREYHRNTSLASVAGSLRDRGLDPETICAVLLEVNRIRCLPPLEDEEVSRIARSIGRYPAGRPRYRRPPVRRVYTKHTKKKER